ncbi:hypothetical protein HDV00_005828 [Rhizophlyctis rosea]|nr:hypothetical protein HDV00_005828 [Rhizophlyctis rosea]
MALHHRHGARLQPELKGYLDQLHSTKVISARLKGKARKQAREAGQPTNPAPLTGQTQPPSKVTKIPVGEIIALADFVTSKGKPTVKVPLRVFLAAQRAVLGRKRCTAWFLSKGLKSEQEARSNEAHWYFLFVFEKVVEVLSPFVERSPDQKSEAQSTEGAADDSYKLGSHEGLEDQNSFSILDSIPFDINEDLGATAGPSTPKASPRGSTPGSGNLVLYTIESDQDKAEFRFSIFCFFDDLHTLRSFINQTWSNYNIGTINIMTASVTTDDALEIVDAPGTASARSRIA